MASADGTDTRRDTAGDTRQLAWLCALALTLLLAGPAFAGKIIVEANGVDTQTCGSKSEPCRTITQGIAQAPEGGTVLVGPGRYGDLDGDNVLGEPEEESPGCDDCTVDVNKRLKIISRAGAGATIIALAPDEFYGVRIGADRVTFGQKKRGFTLAGHPTIALGALGTGIRVAGNLAVAGNVAFEALGANALVRDNAAIGNDGAGFLARSGSRPRIVGNRAIGNGRGSSTSAKGISTVGANATIIGNVATANEANGIGSLRGGDIIQKNVIVGNLPDPLGPGRGIALSYANQTRPVEPTLIKQNLIVGNAGEGVFATVDAASTLEKNVIYGNDVHQNCGVLNDSDTSMIARKNFWGAADGPGAEPADIVCTTNGATLYAPASRPGRIRVRAAR